MLCIHRIQAASNHEETGHRTTVSDVLGGDVLHTFEG